MLQIDLLPVGKWGNFFHVLCTRLLVGQLHSAPVLSSYHLWKPLPEDRGWRTSGCVHSLLIDTSLSAVAERGTDLIEGKLFCFHSRLCSVWIKINITQPGHWYQSDATFQGSSPEPAVWLSLTVSPSMGSFGHPPGSSSCFALGVPSLPPLTPSRKHQLPSLLCSCHCCSGKCYCCGDISLCRLTFPFGRSYSLYSPFYLLLLWLVGHYRGYFNIAVIKDLWW